MRPVLTVAHTCISYIHRDRMATVLRVQRSSDLGKP